jgi:hypothetical protein
MTTEYKKRIIKNTMCTKLDAGLQNALFDCLLTAISQVVEFYKQARTALFHTHFANSAGRYNKWWEMLSSDSLRQ